MHVLLAALVSIMQCLINFHSAIRNLWDNKQYHTIRSQCNYVLTPQSLKLLHWHDNQVMHLHCYIYKTVDSEVVKKQIKNLWKCNAPSELFPLYYCVALCSTRGSLSCIPRALFCRKNGMYSNFSRRISTDLEKPLNTLEGSNPHYFY